MYNYCGLLFSASAKNPTAVLVVALFMVVYSDPLYLYLSVKGVPLDASHRLACFPPSNMGDGGCRCAWVVPIAKCVFL